jgi:hypothetical protein
MNQNCKKVFIRKTSGNQLYKWSPPCNNVTKRGENSILTAKPYFCTATSGSLGQDWITTFVYDIAVFNGQAQHLAYVECDYVE